MCGPLPSGQHRKCWRNSVSRSCAAAEKLDNVVLPYVDDLRNPDGGLKNAGNAQHVRDGDIWVQEYLTGHGIPCYEIVEVET